MNIIEQIEHDFNDYLERLFDISPNLTSKTTFTINADESKAQFGDMSSNAAMILAKALQKRPLEVAELIAGGFTHQYVKNVALHPPGFLNFYLTEEALQQLAREMHEEKKTSLSSTNNQRKT